MELKIRVALLHVPRYPTDYVKCELRVVDSDGVSIVVEPCAACYHRRRPRSGV